MTTRSGAPRQLRTVLFTDIVGSTDVASQLGDRRWRALVVRHHQAIRRELKRHRGREVDTAGDGFFATFETPTDGVRCAAAAVAAVHGLGLRIRAGLHTGEVETTGEKVGGIAVHIAARLLAMAGPEEVLVSSTVRELVAGSGLGFTDRGSHELKGVQGEWHVYALDLPPLDTSVVVASEEDAEAAATVRRRRRLLVGFLAAALALLLVGVVAAVVMPPPMVPVISGPDSVVAFATGDGRAVAGARTGRGPSGAEVADGAVWVTNLGSGTLTRVDVADAGTTTVGQVSGRPSSIAASEDRIWVADRFADQVAILDSGSGELVGQVAVHASALDIGHGATWAADDLHDLVRRLDPRTGVELDAFQLSAGSGPTDVVATEDAVWVAASRGDGLVRLDPRTGLLDPATIEVPGVERLSAAGTDIWAVSPLLDTATRVDTATSRIAARATVCDTPVAVAAVPDGGGAWIVCGTERALWHVDQAGIADRKVALDAVPTDVAIDRDRVWVTLRED